MSLRTSLVLSAAFALVLTGCGGGGTMPKGPAGTSPSKPRTFKVDSFTGTFTEFTAPSGSTPIVLTVGPDNAIWFNKPLSRITSDGTITQYPFPSAYVPSGFRDGMVSTGGAVFSVAVASDLRLQFEQYIVKLVPGGSMSFFDAGAADSPFGNLAVGPDGRIWFPFCVEGCGGGFQNGVVEIMSTGGAADFIRTGDNFLGNVIASGPDHNLYMTGTFDGPQPTSTMSDSLVFQISTAESILNTFNLPLGSNPLGIAAGPDHNLWIAEPGTNKIARMTTAGAFTEFSIPTANATPTRITAGTDGAMWFTEQTAHAIGRITTAGVITEYPVPTTTAQPFDIVACPGVCAAGPHECIWFTEPNVNKIARFAF